MPDLSPDVERELEALDDALAGRRVASDLTELGELALLLREDRPQPGDGFARHLDDRAARGFPKGDPRRRLSGRRRWAWQAWMGPSLAGALTVAIVGVVVVAGQMGGEDDSGSSGSGVVAMSQEESASSSAADDAAGQSGAGGAAAPDSARQATPQSTGESTTIAPAVPPSNGGGSPGTDDDAKRRVERSASLTLAAPPRDIDRVSAGVQDVTRAQGGFVASSSVSSSPTGGGGTFTLRIPTRNLEGAMAALSRLAAVRERAQREQDITAQAVSAQSRLRDARAERESLLEQLADAETLDDAAALRARLRDVAAEIERHKAAVRRVNNRAAFSTVAVTLVADRSAAAPGGEEDDSGWTPGDAWHDARRVLEVIAGIALIALAIAIPLALVAIPTAYALRLARRRRREHALDAV
jgi:hypothetical protein